MPFGPTLAEQILGLTALGSPVTPISTLYLSLCSSIGSAGLTYAEPTSGTAYARQAVAFGAISNRRVRNTNTIQFPAASTPWPNIPHVALFTDPSTGTMVAYATLASTKTIITSTVINVAINSLTYRMD